MKIQTEHFEIELWRKENRAYFEHNDLGDGCAGSITFDDGIVVDYDGVWALKTEIVRALQAQGYKVPNSCCEEDDVGDEE